MTTINSCNLADGAEMSSGGRFAAIWRCFYVLWVCRVSLVSTLAGAYLLTGTVQARDLFADIGIPLWKWFIFFAFVFVWAWIAHAGARRVLQYDDWVPEAHCAGGIAGQRGPLQKLYWWPGVWVPRALSLVVFGSVLFAIYRVQLNLNTAADGIPEVAEALALSWKLMACTVAVAALYIWLTWHRRKFGSWIAYDGSWLYSPPLLAGMVPWFAKSAPSAPQAPRGGLDKAIRIARFVVLILLVVTIVNPHLFATLFPRLFFVPLLFSGAVLLLSEVGAWSLRLRTPLLLGVLAVSVVCVYITTRFHDVRWIKDEADASKNISLAEAVKRWKTVNNCTDDLSKCPRPILIAGAGASRAAYMTSTVVGALVDLGKSKPEIYGDIRSRIFAMSTVSGSSVGAVVMRAAFHDAADRGTPDTPPCLTRGTGSWFGYPNGKFNPKESWRDCFQAILAGDFLSPVFVAMAYRDNFPLPNLLNRQPLWSDRAVMLEEAFERRYHRFTVEGERPTPCPAEPKPAEKGTDGLCRPFGHHPDPKVVKTWVPLLFINGTSVFTGRRIVVSDIKASDTMKSGGTLMPLAYDLGEIRRWKKPETEKKSETEKGENIRLSTASTMSARFPVVSPHGLLRNLWGDSNDYIVDGGYFENDGLVTIADLAAALQKAPHNLDPVVIRVVNEPDELETPLIGPDRPATPTAEQRGWFDDFLSIVRALLATRSGHADAADAYLKQKLVDQSRFFPIGVFELRPPQATADPKRLAPWANPFCRLDTEKNSKQDAKLAAVSMSWWVSQPVQAYLDAQLCVQANWVRLECELREGRTSQGKNCVQEP